MYTKTLTEYLENIHRMPYVSDEKLIRDAFDRNGLKLTDELLDFQLRYAGYYHKLNAEPFIYGLVHEESVYLPPFDVDFDDENPDNILYTCMDCQPTEARALNSQGVFYKDYLPIAESFTKYLEQRAFSWKLSQNVQWETVNLTSYMQDTFKEEPQGKLEEFFVEEISDQYSRIYQLNTGLVIKSTQEQVVAWKQAGTKQQLFYFNL